MLLTFIKYFTIIACNFYIYFKLMHTVPKKSFYYSFVIFICSILPVIYSLKIYAPSLIILGLVISFTIYLTICYKTSISVSMITSVISYGMTYLIFFLSSFLMSTIGYIIFLVKGEYPPTLIVLIFICIIQCIITYLPFRIKRYKNGMPALQNYSSNDIGIFISVFFVLAASFLSVRENKDLVFIIPISFSILCGLSLFFWWRSSITKKYLERIKAREIEELQKIIQESNYQIEQLKQNNDELSKIIHKDNKLIPAMEFAVREYLSSHEKSATTENSSAKGQELLEQLACLTKERTGILANYETNNKQLSPTDLPAIDTLLSYMSRKARVHEISFELSLSGSITQLTKQIMDEGDLRTLLADLIDNAIIATKKAPSRNILVHLGVCNYCYSIDIFDSGELFKEETLSKIGIKRATTHANEGGSGIGLMTTIELIKKCHASFIMEELPDSQLFTKKVSICFDQLGELRIRTSREAYKRSLSDPALILQDSPQRYLYYLQQNS